MEYLKKNLVLTGMMGVGKSTVGKKLAKELKFKFIDVDKIIEKNEKKTIEEIFVSEGESYFRKLEKKTTLLEIKKIHSVVALGGGAFTNEVIRREIKNLCISFWLDLDTKNLLPRLKNSKKRPLINKNNFEDVVNKIYSERKSIYNESNYRINCNQLDLDQIIKKIVKLYESSRN